MVLLKMAAYWLLTFYRAARKIRSFGFLSRNSSRLHQISSLHQGVSKCPLQGRKAQSLVCDIHGTLLRTPSYFPYFMLVAFEGGSILRALMLLLSCPLLWALGHNGGLSLKVMVFITFCGMRTKDMDTVARAVLPKFYLENLNLHAYEILASTGRRVVLTSMPRVMVEGFLREYLGVGQVVGAELQVVGESYFTGLISSGSGMAVRHKALKDLFGDTKPDVGLVCSSNPHDHLFISHCKEVYVVEKASEVMSRDKYPKPLVFHDGRLAFLPTPMATFSLFMWLPLGITLAITRLILGILLPHKAGIILAACLGVRIRFQGKMCRARVGLLSNKCNSSGSQGLINNKGVLYVSNHKTLLDPVVLSTLLGKPLTALTYSLSQMSELIAPIKTVRLTRDRYLDRDTMQRLLSEGDLVVCPEGTTCREPYLLRFSSLFAELANEIVPVAVDVRVSMFYGTTASGFKWLDPIFFLMNPRPVYWVKFLGTVPRELTCAGACSSWEVANRIQRQMADALGFECTNLTRRDKYLMLAGNEGVVKQQ